MPSAAAASSTSSHDMMTPPQTSIEDPRRDSTSDAMQTLDVHRLLEAAGEGIYGLDRSGRTTFVNPAAARMLGYEADELLGRLQHDAIHHRHSDGSEYPRNSCPIYECINRGTVRTVTDEVFWRKDGTSFPVEYTTTPVRVDGEVVGGVVTFRDVTERVRALAELQRSREVLHRAQVIAQLGSWEWTIAEDRVVWSDQLHRIYGVEPGEFGGTSRDFLDRLHPEERPRIEAAIGRALETGEPFEFEERIVRPDGSVRILESQGEVECDASGTPVRMAGICRDVTAARDAERRERELLAVQVRRSEAENFEVRMRTILDSMTDGFFAIDPDWTILHINAGGARMVGRTQEELRNKNLWDEFPEARDTVFYQHYRNALTSQEAVSFESFYEPLGVWFDVRVSPSDEGLAVFFQDVTEEKTRAEALRVSEARYRFLTDALPQQLWTSRPDGRLDFVNGKTVEYFDRPADAIVGDGWQHVIHPDDLAGVVERWTHSLQTGEPYEVEFRLRRADGTYRWHLGRAEPQRAAGGEILHWVGTNTDFHDQKEAEAARDRALVELKRSNDELDRFAYVASHDLKAPLRGIANLASWIEDDLGAEVGDETRHHLELLQTRVHRLEELIDGLLQYSRAGRGDPSFQEIDVEAIVRDAIDLLDPPPSVQVDLRIDDLPPVRAEGSLFKQIVLNLVSNAIKYNDRDEPHVVISARLGAPGFVEVAVEDDGPGIAPRYHDRIWEIFQTLQPRDRVESTGIGLAIVKKIVEARGGVVSVESDEGEGATFRFTWPTLPRNRHADV